LCYFDPAHTEKKSLFSPRFLVTPNIGTPWNDKSIFKNNLFWRCVYRTIRTIFLK